MQVPQLCLAFRQFFPTVWAASLLVVLGTYGWGAAAQGPSAQQEERARIATNVLQNQDLAALAAQGKLRALSVAPYTPAKDEPAAPANAASVIVFSYGEGRAYRVLYDPVANHILQRQPLSGHPQPSQDEIYDAYQLIRSDPAHAQLLAAGNVLEGGFAVNGPPGSPLRDRFVQVQMLSRDRKSFVRVITVDLTTEKIASSVSKR
jgi:hypothetical protein